jgi:hypothetical protein
LQALEELIGDYNWCWFFFIRWELDFLKWLRFMLKWLLLLRDYWGL